MVQQCNIPPNCNFLWLWCWSPAVLWGIIACVTVAQTQDAVFHMKVSAGIEVLRYQQWEWRQMTVCGSGMPTLTFSFTGSSQGYQILHIHTCGDLGDYIAYDLPVKAFVSWEIKFFKSILGNVKALWCLQILQLITLSPDEMLIYYSRFLCFWARLYLLDKKKKNSTMKYYYNLT